MTSFHTILTTFVCCDVARHAAISMDLNELVGNIVLGFWLSMLMHAFLGIIFPGFSARIKELNAAGR